MVEERVIKERCPRVTPAFRSTIYRAARSKVSNFPFLGLSSLLSVTTDRRLLRGCCIPWELYIYIYIYIVAKIYGSIRSRNKSCRCEHHSFLRKLPFLRTDWNRQVFQQTTKQAFPEYMEPIKISVNSQTTVTLEMKSNSVDKYLLSSLPMVYQWNIILLDEKFKRNKIDIDRRGKKLLLFNQIFTRS